RPRPSGAVVRKGGGGGRGCLRAQPDRSHPRLHSRGRVSRRPDRGAPRRPPGGPADPARRDGRPAIAGDGAIPARESRRSGDRRRRVAAVGGVPGLGVLADASALKLLLARGLLLRALFLRALLPSGHLLALRARFGEADGDRLLAALDRAALAAAAALEL